MEQIFQSPTIVLVFKQPLKDVNIQWVKQNLFVSRKVDEERKAFPAGNLLTFKSEKVSCWMEGMRFCFAVDNYEGNALNEIANAAFKAASAVKYNEIMSFGINFLYKTVLTPQLKFLREGDIEPIKSEGYILQSANFSRLFTKDNYHLKINFDLSGTDIYVDSNFDYQVGSLERFTGLFKSQLIKDKENELAHFLNVHYGVF